MSETPIGPQQEECCAQCPYARATPKEYLDTRGDNAEEFAGQSIGNFLLPCHMTKEFLGWRDAPAPQCAGAAKHRANIKVAKLLSGSLGSLPEDHENVFSTSEELIAHHKGITAKEAASFLEKTTLFMMYEKALRLALAKNAKHNP